MVLGRPIKERKVWERSSDGKRGRGNKGQGRMALASAQDLGGSPGRAAVGPLLPKFQEQRAES
jgi:hypothetical protein